MSRNNGYTARAADLISLLHKAPRTRAELVGVTGMSSDSVAHWINALESEGLIAPTGQRRAYRGRGRGSTGTVFGWVRLEPAPAIEVSTRSTMEHTTP